MARLLHKLAPERGRGSMLGIEIGSWFATTTNLGAGVPLLDPGPLASVFALAVAIGLMWHARRRSPVVG